MPLHVAPPTARALVDGWPEDASRSTVHAWTRHIRRLSTRRWRRPPAVPARVGLLQPALTYLQATHTHHYLVTGEAFNPLHVDMIRDELGPDPYTLSHALLDAITHHDAIGIRVWPPFTGSHREYLAVVAGLTALIAADAQANHRERTRFLADTARLVSSLPPCPIVHVVNDGRRAQPQWLSGTLTIIEGTHTVDIIGVNDNAGLIIAHSTSPLIPTLRDTHEKVTWRGEWVSTGFPADDCRHHLIRLNLHATGPISVTLSFLLDEHDYEPGQLDQLFDVTDVDVHVHPYNATAPLHATAPVDPLALARS